MRRAGLKTSDNGQTKMQRVLVTVDELAVTHSLTHTLSEVFEVRFASDGVMDLNMLGI
jgi:hypothetical protein